MKKLMDLIMNTCKEVSIELANSEDLTPIEQLKQKFHLMICPSCRNFSQQMQLLSDSVKKIKIKDLDLREFNRRIITKYQRKAE